MGIRLTNFLFSGTNKLVVNNTSQCKTNKHHSPNYPKVICSCTSWINTISLKNNSDNKSDNVRKGNTDRRCFSIKDKRDHYSNNPDTKQYSRPLLHSMNIKKYISAQNKATTKHAQRQ